MKRRSGKRQRQNSTKSKGLSNERSLSVRRDGIPQLLVDCSPICYAALHTTGVLSYGGRPTGVIYGFIKKLFDLSFKFKTNKVIFFWDARRLYIYDYFPEYKAKRKEMREQMEAEDAEDFLSMLDQMVQLSKEILPALGFRNSFVFHGYEADDLIGHILKQKILKGRKIIISSDADLYQLLHLADMYLHTSEKIFTKRLFEKKYGISVHQWVLAKAIGGCASDEIPGVEGVGDPKSPSSKALKYIRDELPRGKIYDRIVQSQKQIRYNKILNRVPFRQRDIPPMQIRNDEVTIRKISRTFVKYGFQSLCERDYFDQIREIWE